MSVDYTFDPSVQPDFGSQRTFKPRVLKAEFGDGYLQRAGDGLNYNPLNHVLTWSNLNASEKDEIINFFSARRGWQSFYYTYQDQSQPSVFVCEEWSFQHDDANFNYTINATLKQVYDVSPPAFMGYGVAMQFLPNGGYRSGTTLYQGGVAGPNGVTNSTFTSYVTGWSSNATGQITAVWSNGVLLVTHVTTISTGVVTGTTGLSALPGQRYRLRGKMTTSSGTYARIIVDVGGAQSLIRDLITDPDGTVDVEWTNQFTGAMSIKVLAGNSGGAGPAGTYATFDSVYVSEVYGPCSLTGGTYTRTVTVGFVDSTGVVNWFEAYRPPIDKNGYHCFGSRTQLGLRSQELDNASWTKSNTTVTADQATAPDNTMTMDMIVENTSAAAHNLSQSITFTAVQHTASVFLKQGTRRYASLGAVKTGGTTAWVTADLQLGTIASNGSADAAYIVNCGNGIYRLVLVWTPAASATALTLALSDVSTAPGTGTAAGNSYTGTSATIYAWQLQAQAGNFPDGGSLILTTSAQVTVAADVMSNTTNPVTNDVDFIWWGVADLTPAVASVANVFASLGTGHYIGRHTDGKLLAAIVGATSYFSTAAQNAAGRYVVLYRRKGGKNTLAYKLPNGTVTIETESGSTAFTAATSSLYPGTYTNGSSPVQGILKGVYMKVGTFVDADLTAILTSA